MSLGEELHEFVFFNSADKAKIIATFGASTTFDKMEYLLNSKPADLAKKLDIGELDISLFLNFLSSKIKKILVEVMQKGKKILVFFSIYYYIIKYYLRWNEGKIS